MKYYCRMPKNQHEELQIFLMKLMVLDLTYGVKIDDLWAAKNDEGTDGVVCFTEKGGKKFWTFDELGRLFARKNKETKRFRF